MEGIPEGQSRQEFGCAEWRLREEGWRQVRYTSYRASIGVPEPGESGMG